MKNNKGSLTVEACLSLTMFLMIFVTILYIMRIVFAYEIVQHALNQTAKEISAYSYYYAASGMADINGQVQSSTAGGIEHFNQNMTNVVNVYQEFSELGNIAKEQGESAKKGDWDGIVSGLQNAGEKYSDFQDALGPAADTLKSVADDPVAAIKSVGSVLLNGGNEAAKTFLCGEISRNLMSKYIAGGSYQDADTRLKNLRIDGGMDGLDFSASSFWSAGNEQDIELVVCYTIKPVFPFKIVDKLNFINKITVRGWSGKSVF